MISLLQISFVLPIEAVPGRVGLLLTVLLCTINIFNSLETKYPKNATSIINWVLSCIIFVTLPLLEYAFILGYKKYKKPGRIKEKESDCDTHDQRVENLLKRIDRFMLVVFPPTFTVFAVLFWIQL